MAMRPGTGTQYQFGGSGSESGSGIAKMRNTKGYGYRYVIQGYDFSPNTRDIAKRAAKYHEINQSSNSKSLWIRLAPIDGYKEINGNVLTRQDIYCRIRNRIRNLSLVSKK
jgi:hypothetical protein